MEKKYIKEVIETKLQNDNTDIKKYESEEYKKSQEKVRDKITKKYKEKIELARENFGKYINMYNDVLSADLEDNKIKEFDETIKSNVKPLPQISLAMKYLDYISIKGTDEERLAAFESRLEKINIKIIEIFSKLSNYLFNEYELFQYVKQLHNKNILK